MPDAEQFTPSTQDILAQLYGAAQQVGNAKPAAVNTTPMQATLNQEKALATQIPSAVPKAPQLNTQLPSAPQSPDIQPLETFSQYAPAMIVLGSLFARGPSTAAADAAAAAMNAYKQGKTEEYTMKRQEWEDKTKEMLDKNKIELDAYKTALEESRGNMDLLQAKMTAVANQFKDENTLGMLKAGNSEKAVDLQMKKLEAWQKVSDAKSKIDRGGGTLSDEDLSLMAKQYLGDKDHPGDKSVLTGLGYGNAGAANRAALRHAITQEAYKQGLSGPEIGTRLAEFSALTAAERTVGQRGANVDMFANEAKNMGTTLRQASSAVKRSDFVPLGNGEVSFDVQSGSPQAAAYVAALNSYINAYAKAVNGGSAPLVSDKEHARDFILKGMGDKQLGAVLDILDKEMDNAIQAPGQVKAQLRGSEKPKIQNTKTLNGKTYHQDENGDWYE